MSAVMKILFLNTVIELSYVKVIAIWIMFFNYDRNAKTVKVSKSTNINKTSNHPLPQIIEHVTLEIHVHTRDRHDNMAWLNWWMRSLPSSLENLISNCKFRCKQTKRHGQIRFHSKRQHAKTKMNDNININININMDSTIVNKSF